MNGERLCRAGVDGVGTPRCYYLPQPPYTDEARKAKLSGSLLIEGVVYKDGSLKNLRLMRGLLFGLSDTALRTVATWKCNPAMLNGEPVAVYVPIEITFKMY